MHIPSAAALEVDTLGGCAFPSPFLTRQPDLPAKRPRVLVASTDDELSETAGEPPSFEAAGPRARLFFDPAQTSCGVLTCGGLCPGLNDVIRSITLTLRHGYGIERVLGFRYGYAGLADPSWQQPMQLTPERVRTIHENGGTILGTSRGPQAVELMVDNLERLGISALFVIGGDGTLRGAQALAAEVRQRQTKIAVVGIPKTIDNDLRFIERCFGFATAVEEARRVLTGAHAEARGAFNGVGLVKLMGRHAGFIAAHASLANADVNFCLIPEVSFDLEGERGFLAALEGRLRERQHAVVVAAEGAGQHLFGDEEAGRDASGNKKLHDIGLFLRNRIRRHFAERDMPIGLKYIDPSYTIRSRPANSMDSELCLILGQHAVHAALAGRTNLMIGYWSRSFTHVPLHLATSPRTLDPVGPTWKRVLEATGQPIAMSA